MGHWLVNLRSGRSKQGHLRRSISSAYYAVFHALARCCADLLIGGPGSRRSKPAWSRVYRALDHGTAKSACANKTMIAKFPREIQEFSRAFVQLQLKRHEADYDPDATMYKSAALANIAIIETVITEFSNVPLKHRRAFARMGAVQEAELEILCAAVSLSSVRLDLGVENPGSPFCHPRLHLRSMHVTATFPPL
jgi:uncharacterized protein (UPF0332 family)